MIESRAEQKARNPSPTRPPDPTRSLKPVQNGKPENRAYIDPTRGPSGSGSVIVFKYTSGSGANPKPEKEPDFPQINPSIFMFSVILLSFIFFFSPSLSRLLSHSLSAAEAPHSAKS